MPEYEGVLELRQLSKSFGGLKAVSDLSMLVKPNEIVGLIGPNGAGKSTVFNLITGVEQPTSGQVFFGGEDITGFVPHRITKKGIVRTFQIVTIFPHFTALENVEAAYHLHSKSGFFRSLLDTPFHRREQKEFKEKAMNMIEDVGISHLASVPAGSMSIGQQRLLSLAIVLTVQPKLLLLDEIVTGLTVQEVDDVIGEIRKISDRGTGIVVVEHHMRVIMNICSRIVVLNFGQKIAEGSPEEIANNNEVVEAYLGSGSNAA